MFGDLRTDMGERLPAVVHAAWRQRRSAESVPLVAASGIVRPGAVFTPGVGDSG
jgi:hypothetical protein